VYKHHTVCTVCPLHTIISHKLTIGVYNQMKPASTVAISGGYSDNLFSHHKWVIMITIMRRKKAR